MRKWRQKLVRAVDFDLVKNHRSFAIFVPAFALALLRMTTLGWEATAQIVLWSAAAVLTLPWYLFVGWRAWRLAQASFWRGGRHYDQVGKFHLPPEYAATESATAVRRRRWRARWRRRRERG